MVRPRNLNTVPNGRDRRCMEGMPLHLEERKSTSSVNSSSRSRNDPSPRFHGLAVSGGTACPPTLHSDHHTPERPVNRPARIPEKYLKFDPVSRAANLPMIPVPARRPTSFIGLWVSSVGPHQSDHNRLTP